MTSFYNFCIPHFVMEMIWIYMKNILQRFNEKMQRFSGECSMFPVQMQCF